MLKNYFKIAIRNLLKNKVYSSINILGLAFGLATSLLIFFYVVDEWSYDKFNQNSDRIYRIVQTMSSEDRDEEQASTPFLLAPSAEAEFPDFIEKSVRFYDMQENSHTFRYKKENLSFKEENFYFVDSTFFNVFSAELIIGNPSEALKNPNSIVISEDLVEKYFGDEDPIGKVLNYKGVSDLAVTGVMKSWPDQSHMKIDLLASYTTLNTMYTADQKFDQSWLWNPIWTYIQLKEGVDPEVLKSQLPVIVEKYYQAYSGWPTDESVSLDLQPLTDIYLKSQLDQEMNPNSDIVYLYILLTVAGFILMIACINFMNLSTARSLERSREVGMRKVLGGHKKQLFYQFIGESFLISFIAIAIGVILTFLTLPFFNELVDKNISLSLIQQPWMIPWLLLLSVLVGLFAGSYPAVYLSSFEPVKVLKSSTVQGKKSSLFRKILVTFQFSLSVILIIGTAIIYTQLQFIQQKDLGFDESSVVHLPSKQNLIAWEFGTFREQALAHTQIENVTGVSKIMGSENHGLSRFVPAGDGQNQDELNVTIRSTYDLIETFDLTLIAGRSFSRDFTTDTESAILINRKMVTKLGFDDPEDALGELFYFYPKTGGQESYNVIGVVEDFNYSSLKKEIEPLVIAMAEDLMSFLGFIEYTAVEISPGNPQPALEHLEKVWKQVNPIDPFEYRFLDERLAEIYEAESMMSSLATAFSILCVIIACLGLLGLASYSAQLKKSEIGIRKTLGASVLDIVSLLSKDFLVLVVIANLIAWPVTYFIASSWLENFTYRFDLLTNLPIIFLVSGLLIMLIAMLTVGYHAIKSALINPVNAIRSD